MAPARPAPYRYRTGRNMQFKTQASQQTIERFEALRERLNVSKAIPGAKIVMADDDAELKKALDGGVDLVLFNRLLDYGFDQTEGVEVIRRLSIGEQEASLLIVMLLVGMAQSA